jgi:hypothetical protein
MTDGLRLFSWLAPSASGSCVLFSSSASTPTGHHNVYVHRFRVPLDRIAAEDYLFTVGSGDDGFHFNMGLPSKSDRVRAIQPALSAWN